MRWVTIYMMDPSEVKRVLYKNLKKYRAQGWECEGRRISRVKLSQKRDRKKSTRRIVAGR